MKKDYTHLVLVLDASGSMSHLQKATIEGVNSLVAEQKKQPGTLTTAVYVFNGTVKEVDHFTELTPQNYIPMGSTALLDAVGLAMEQQGKVLAMLPEEQRPDKVVVVVDTDGAENASTNYKLEDIKAQIELQKTTYGWEFVFLGANIDAFATGGTYGFAVNSTMQYTPTSNGVFSKYATVTASVANFRSGATASVDLTNKTV